MRLTKSAGEIFYQELRDVGIKIFERQGTMLHIKAMVIDGVWSTLGSANMNDRSFLINYECNVTVADRHFGEMMEGMFEEDLIGSREITLKNWKNRPWWKRLKTTLLTPIIPQR